MALFVVALQVGLSDHADASCGDWLAHDTMSATGPEVEEHLAEAGRPQQAPSPCSQGQCRQAPDFPVPSAPQRSLTPQPDQWGALADLSLRLKSANGHFDLEVPLNFPAALRQPLERPPRV